MDHDQVDLTQAKQDARKESRLNRQQTLLMVVTLGAIVLLAGLNAVLVPLVIRSTSPSDQSSQLNQWVSLALLTGLFFFVFEVIFVWFRLRQIKVLSQGRRKVAEALMQVAPELPRDQIAIPAQEPLTGKQKAFIGLAAFGLGAAVALVNTLTVILLAYIWPSAPDPVTYIPMVIMLAIAFSLSDYFVPALRNPGSTAKPLGHTLRNVGGWAIMLVAIFAIISIVQDAGKNWLSSVDQSQALLLALAMAGIFLLAALIGLAVDWAPIKWVLSAIGAGRYDVALRRAQTLRRLKRDWAPFIALEAAALHYGGHWDEELALLNSSLIEGQRQVVVAVQATNLANRGLTLRLLGRNEDAKASFEGSIQIMPGIPSPYYGLAELYLTQGIEPQRALDLVEQAIRMNKSQTPTTRSVNSHLWGKMWSIKAWAHALSGDHEAAQKALDEAFRFAAKGFRPELAMVNYRAAQVAKLGGDAAVATEYLNKAIALDPDGGAGQIARKALKT